MIYWYYQKQSEIMDPIRTLARAAAAVLGPWSEMRSALPLHNLSAFYEMIGRAELTHGSLGFQIPSVMVGNDDVPVTEEAADITPFGTLLHFKKDVATAQPRVLVVAPLSGHFATLLRGTVRTLLAEHDVYVTDWHNARDAAARGRTFRLRRLCRPHHPFSRKDRSGRARRRGLPALRAGARRRRRDGGGR